MTEVYPPVRAVLEFDAIRVYFGETLHIDIRRRTYRGMQTYIWPNNYTIEFWMADCEPMKTEYTDVARFRAVVKALQELPLNGE